MIHKLLRRRPNKVTQHEKLSNGHAQLNFVMYLVTFWTHTQSFFISSLSKTRSRRTLLCVSLTLNVHNLATS